MDSVYGRCSLSLLACILALSGTGCASFDAGSCWAPFRKQADDDLADIPSPAKRIASLRELARNASRATPEQRQQVAAELVESIRTEEDPLIRAEIVRALGAYPGPAADAVLRAALSDPDAEVRVAACEIWGDRGDAEATALLAEVLDRDADVDVRLAAAAALGESENPAAAAALGLALEDRDPAMQYRAVLSLRRLTGKNFGNDVNRWRQYVAGRLPEPASPPSIAERLRQVF